jgi:hypothetical protein
MLPGMTNSPVTVVRHVYGDIGTWEMWEYVAVVGGVEKYDGL